MDSLELLTQSPDQSHGIKPNGDSAISPLVPVTLRGSNDRILLGLAKANTATGFYSPSGFGISFAQHRLQVTADLNSAIWTTLGTNTAATDGRIQFGDAKPPDETQRFFRSVSP